MIIADIIFKKPTQVGFNKKKSTSYKKKTSYQKENMEGDISLPPAVTVRPWCTYCHTVPLSTHPYSGSSSGPEPPHRNHRVRSPCRTGYTSSNLERRHGASNTFTICLVYTSSNTNWIYLENTNSFILIVSKIKKKKINKEVFFPSFVHIQYIFPAWGKCSSPCTN